MEKSDMGYHEKAAWVSAAVTIGVFIPYFVSLYWWLGWTAQAPLPTIWVTPMFVVAIGLYVLVLAVSHLLIGGWKGEARKDERDMAIEARAIKYGYYVLSSMIGTVLFTPTPWGHLMTFHVVCQILFFCFVVSELVIFLTTAVGYRRRM